MSTWKDKHELSPYCMGLHPRKVVVNVPWYLMKLLQLPLDKELSPTHILIHSTIHKRIENVSMFIHNIVSIITHLKILLLNLLILYCFWYSNTFNPWSMVMLMSKCSITKLTTYISIHNLCVVLYWCCLQTR